MSFSDKLYAALLAVWCIVSVWCITLRVIDHFDRAKQKSQGGVKR